MSRRKSCNTWGWAGALSRTIRIRKGRPGDVQYSFHSCTNCTLENVARHPTSGISKPVDRQTGLIVALECTKVLGMVDQNELELALSCQVSPQQDGESLNVLKPGADFSSFVMYVRTGIFFHCKPISSMLKTCWVLYPPSSMMALRQSG